MIYLFNSAFRKLYKNNIIKTLALPKGYDNNYRYAFSGNNIQVSEETILNMANLINSEVVVIFIDRYTTNKYTYYPLRLGKLLSSQKTGERFKIQVECGDFIYPKSLDKFNELLVEELGQKGLAQLTNHNPNEKNDGLYAVIGNNIFEEQESYYYDDEAWSHSTEALLNTEKFNWKNVNDFVLLKTSILDQEDNELVPVHDKESSFFELSRNSKYIFSVNYKYPPQYNDTEAFSRLLVNVSGPLINQGPINICLSSKEENNEIELNTLNLPENPKGKISFTVPSDFVDPEILINVRLAKDPIHTIKVILAFILLAVCSVVVVLDVNTKISMDWFLTNGWIRALASFFQLVSLYWLIKLTGKQF